MSDTIADMLTRLRNAAAAKHKTVDVKNSRICQGIAKVLKEEGYITDFSVLDDGTKHFEPSRIEAAESIFTADHVERCAFLRSCLSQK